MSWNISKLGEECKIFSGNSINAKTKESLYTNVEGTPYIATKDITYDGNINYLNGISIPEEDHDKFRKAKSECVFICAEGGSAGRKIAFSDTECFFVNKLFCLEAGSNLLPKYIYYYLRSEAFQIQFKNALTGLIGGVSLSKIKLFEITYPSLPVQKQIVEKLDAAFADIDKAINATEKNIENADLLYQTQVNKKMEIADVENIKLKDIANLMYGYTAKASHEITGTPLLRITDIQDNNVDWSGVPNCKISNEDIDKYRLNEGDIVFARTGATTGKSYLIQSAPNAVFASYLIKLSADKTKFLPEFLIHYFRSYEYWKAIRTGMSGAAQGGFNASKLGDLEVPNVDLKSQASIASELDELVIRSNNIKNIYKKKKNSFLALKSSILNHAFSGELTKDAA